MNNVLYRKFSFITAKTIAAALLVIALLLLTAVNLLPTASADSPQYHYITADTTLLLDDDNVKGSISLPKSYYVQKTSEANTTLDGAVYKTVIYNGVKGKVKESSVSVKTMTVTAPYYSTETALKTPDSHQIMLKFNLPGADGVISGKQLPAASSLTFIAHTPDGKDFFVKCGDDYGFVEKSLCTPSDIVVASNSSAVNPDDPVQSVGGNPNDDKDKGAEKKNNTVKIILICGICILSVLVVFLIFKPMKKKKPPKSNFYDM